MLSYYYFNQYFCYYYHYSSYNLFFPSYSYSPSPCFSLFSLLSLSLPLLFFLPFPFPYFSSSLIPPLSLSLPQFLRFPPLPRFPLFLALLPVRPPRPCPGRSVVLVLPIAKEEPRDRPPRVPGYVRAATNLPPPPAVSCARRREKPAGTVILAAELQVAAAAREVGVPPTPAFVIIAPTMRVRKTPKRKNTSPRPPLPQLQSGVGEARRGVSTFALCGRARSPGSCAFLRTILQYNCASGSAHKKYT